MTRSTVQRQTIRSHQGEIYAKITFIHDKWTLEFLWTKSCDVEKKNYRDEATILKMF